MRRLFLDQIVFITNIFGKMSEQIADGTVETPSVEDLQAALSKAEAKIVELKKAPKEEAPVIVETVKAEGDETVVTTEEESLEDKITRAVAAATIANNNVTANNMSLSGTPAPVETFSPKTLSEYNSLSQSEQVKHMSECIEKTGEFSFKQEENL